MWRLHPDVRSKLHDLRLFNNPPQTPSRASIFAPKLIIQSVVKSDDKVKNDVEEDLPPLQPINSGESKDGNQCPDDPLDCGSDLLSSNFKEIDEELGLETGWWAEALTKNIDGLMADLAEDQDSDPCLPFESSSEYPIDTPKSPTSVQPWVDERLNLEELDTILGLK